MADRVNPTAAVGFDRSAADYERARPGYPAEVLPILSEALGLAPGARVCDLAAGTGKLTRLLVDGGFDIVAVEPVEGMRRQLEQALPDVTVVDGTAEAIPLPDGSMDAVMVGQAFHWFRFDEALAEIARVLRPGGGLAIVFNRRDESAPWVQQWSEVIEWHKRTVSEYQRTDWQGVMATAGFVDGFGATEVPWVQPMTRSLLEGRVRSISYIALMEPAEQQAKVDAVLALVDGFDEPFELPYTTLLWWARRPTT